MSLDGIDKVKQGIEVLKGIVEKYDLNGTPDKLEENEASIFDAAAQALIEYGYTKDELQKVKDYFMKDVLERTSDDAAAAATAAATAAAAQAKQAVETDNAGNANATAAPQAKKDDNLEAFRDTFFAVYAEGKHPVDIDKLIADSEAQTGTKMSRKQKQTCKQSAAAKIYYDAVREFLDKNGTSKSVMDISIQNAVIEKLDDMGYGKYNSLVAKNFVQEFSGSEKYYDQRKELIEAARLDKDIEDRRAITNRDELYKLYGTTPHRKAILDALTVSNPNAAQNDYIILDKSTGKVNFANFSDFAGTHTGAENILNDESTYNKKIGEKDEWLNSIRGMLLANGYTDKATKDDIYDLMRLTGRKVETRSQKVFGSIPGLAPLFGAGAGSAGALVSELLRVKEVLVPVEPLMVTVNAMFKLNLMGIEESMIDQILDLPKSNLADLIEKYGEELGNAIYKLQTGGQSITRQGTQITMQTTVEQLVERPDIVAKLKPRYGEAAVEGALTGLIVAAAADFLTAMIEGKDEKPVISTRVHTDSYDVYVKSLPKNKYGTMMALIALKFRNDDGTLRNTEMERFIHDNISGNGVLNKDELAAWILGYKPEVVKPEEPKKEAPVVKPNIIATAETSQSKFTKTPVPKFNAYYSDWPTLISLYPCFEANPKFKNLSQKDKARILKLAQGIGDGNYSEERMLDLLAHKSDYAYLAQIPKFDLDAYKNQLSARNFANDANLKLPENLAGCTRVQIVEVNGDHGKEFLKTKNKHKQQAGVVNKGGKSDNIIRETSEKIYYVKYKDADGNIKQESFTDMQKRDLRTVELQREGNTIINKWDNDLTGYNEDDLSKAKKEE